MISVGQEAPDFELPIHTGGTFRLSDCRGKTPAVVYFYPKDFTTNCTKEACSFRNGYNDIQQFGAQVLGISGDAIESHKKFARVHRLNFPLASDASLDVCRAYGVLSFGFRIRRATFVIDKRGIIQGKFVHEILIGRHLDDVLRLLQEMNSNS